MRCRERGMVTAELATVSTFGVAFAFLLLWIVSLGVTQVRIVDASREAARMVARGDSVAAAIAVAEHNSPQGAQVKASTARGLVTVRISADSAMPVPFFSRIGSRTMTATAVAADESP